MNAEPYINKIIDSLKPLTISGQKIITDMVTAACEEAAEEARASVPEGSRKTMRDEFALAALPGLADHSYTASFIARNCYAIADAMIEARKK